jgi:ABC-type lipoprotein release transport system permease subunit
MSKLLGFKYLRFRSLFVLTLILILASTLFSVTALSFLGFYNSFNAYLGEENNIIAIYDVQSRTPFTGIIPAYLTNQVSTINGVLACSPEVITPCIVHNQSLFIRGIVPEEFYKLNPITMTEGKILNQSGINSILIGKNLATRLNVKVNDEILVLAALADRYLELQVTGVYSSHSSMDDEALVLLNVGQWLRATDYNHVTMIRAKINPTLVGSNEIYQDLSRNASSTQAKTSQSTTNQATIYQEMIPWTNINFPIGHIGVKGAQSLMESYLARYGITEQALIVLSVMVFLFSSVTVAVASQTLMQQHREDIATLRSLGASRKTLKFDILCKLLPLSLVASGLGILITALILTVLQGYDYLQVLSHEVIFSFDPVIVVLNFVLVLTLVAVSIACSDLD